MEQQRLFYNISSDLWSFSKTLTKPGNEMTDEDWGNAIALMEKTAQKYKTLGEREYALAYSTMLGVLDYIESKDNVRTPSETD